MNEYLEYLIKYCGKAGVTERFQIMNKLLDEIVKEKRDGSLCGEKTASCLTDISEYLNKTIVYISEKF